jgi:hypothetical protein
MDDTLKVWLIRRMDLEPLDRLSARRLERDSDPPCRVCGRLRRVLGLLVCSTCWNPAGVNWAPARRPENPATRAHQPH